MKKELKLCKFKSTDEENILICEECQQSMFSKSSPDKTRRKCKPNKLPLGDILESGLKAIGVTKERVEGITGKKCGCSERKTKLNDLGQSISNLFGV